MNDLTFDAGLGVAIGLIVAWWMWCLLDWLRELRVRRRIALLMGGPLRPVGRLRRVWIHANKRAIRRLRRYQWQRDLPDFFELLALAQSAGTSLPRSWSFACHLMSDRPLHRPLAAVESMLKIGHSWDAALTAPGPFAGVRAALIGSDRVKECGGTTDYFD